MSFCSSRVSDVSDDAVVSGVAALSLQTDVTTQESDSKQNSQKGTMPSHLTMFGRGVYDLHITVDEAQLYDVILFAQQKSIHLAFPVGNRGTHCRQLMTSQHIADCSAVEVFRLADDLVREMQRNFGIRVLRVKIEAMANSDAVQSSFAEFMRTPEYAANHKYCFEFHFKVRIADQQQRAKFEQICLAHSISYSINALTTKPDKYPLVSQRLRGRYEDALKSREAFREALFAAGLILLHDGTHFEAIIYDSFPQLDDGFVPDAVEC